MQGIRPQRFLHFPTIDYRSEHRKNVACFDDQNILPIWHY